MNRFIGDHIVNIFPIDTLAIYDKMFKLGIEHWQDGIARPDLIRLFWAYRYGIEIASNRKGTNGPAKG